MAYDSKNELVRANQLKSQSLHLNFSVAGNATPASVVVTADDPALLFIKTEGTDRITVAQGALDSGDTTPTYTAPNDANGQFAVLVRVGEKVKKVKSAKCVRRNGQEVISCELTSSPSDSIAGVDKTKIALNCNSGAAFTSGTFDACLELVYEIDEN